MLRDLADLTNPNWARVAGQDTNLPPLVNGHDEFVKAWTARMLSALHGLPAGVFRQPFRSAGFVSNPVKKPAENVIVVVPGAQKPGEAIVIGAHPDGEPTSKGSAFDDASGCVIMIGLARELGNVWRARGLPSRTVEFVLFDGEEQGLDGSINYAFDLHHGSAMPRPVLMIDEEQSGIGYPARPFGRRSNPPLPSFAITNPAAPLAAAPPVIVRWILDAIVWYKNASAADLGLAMKRALDAGAAAFTILHGRHASIQYAGGAAAAFGPGDKRFLQIGPNKICCSDNAPFELLGLPTVTFTGNSDYYSSNSQPWSFPYDQPEDTLQAMACDTGGAPTPGPSLAAALELPMVMSERIVEAYSPPASGHGFAVFSLPPGAGTKLRLSAFGAGSVRWNFGDGSTASGAAVSHVYRNPGTYKLTASSGSARSTWQITVGSVVPVSKTHPAGRPPPRRPWSPAQLQNIPGCH
jgi:Peptidase family M28/PKD domain